MARDLGTGCRRGTGLNEATSNGASLSAFARNPCPADERRENDAEQSVTTRATTGPPSCVVG